MAWGVGVGGREGVGVGVGGRECCSCIETGTPPRPHCAGLLSLTRPVILSFLFWHSSSICFSSGKMTLVASFRTKAIFKTVIHVLFYLLCTFRLCCKNLVFFFFSLHLFFPTTDTAYVWRRNCSDMKLLFQMMDVSSQFYNNWPTLCTFQPSNCGSCLIRRPWTSMASTGWTSLTTLNWHAGTLVDSQQHRCYEQIIHYSLLIGQRSPVPEVDNPPYKRSLLHQWLQWIRTLLHNTAHLQCNCQWNWTVSVLLQRPETGGSQDFCSCLRVCQRYNSCSSTNTTGSCTIVLCVFIWCQTEELMRTYLMFMTSSDWSHLYGRILTWDWCPSTVIGSNIHQCQSKQ